MVQAELKQISISDDVLSSDGSFMEDEPFNVPLHATIGMVGREGGDLFIFKACNILWIKSVTSSGQAAVLNKTIVCGGVMLSSVEHQLGAIVSKVRSREWDGVVKYLSAISDWEFSA